MQAGIDNGWLTNARQLASPNCDDRPDAAMIDLVVIHAISLPPGHFGGPYIDQLFTNSLDSLADPYFAEIEGLQVSAHTLIRRDGSITQYVPFHRRAWHAGQSSYGERENCNDFSIGIELEGGDDHPYEPAQYQTLVVLLQLLMHRYPAITPERVCGHCDIAPGRKTDPGPTFDWAYLRQLLSTETAAQDLDSGPQS